jgi:nitroimidazol reductase NimA-like FMN-containing flavoprotein (pyridoxamine 5'-phosphate oxidase superfamily)
MMRHNPRVCFEMDELFESGSWTSVIVQGTFEELSGEDADHVLRVLGHEPPDSDQKDEEQRRGEGKSPVAFRIRALKVTGRRVLRS